MSDDYKDMTPEAHDARERSLALVDWQLYGCAVSRMNGHACELMDGHEGPCKYVRKGTWYESSPVRRTVE